MRYIFWGGGFFIPKCGNNELESAKLIFKVKLYYVGRLQKAEMQFNFLHVRGKSLSYQVVVVNFLENSILQLIQVNGLKAYLSYRLYTRCVQGILIKGNGLDMTTGFVLFM